MSNDSNPRLGRGRALTHCLSQHHESEWVSITNHISIKPSTSPKRLVGRGVSARLLYSTTSPINPMAALYNKHGVLLLFLVTRLVTRASGIQSCPHTFSLSLFRNLSLVMVMVMAPSQIPNMSKRPRLSLQIKTACNPPSKGLRGQPVNPSDPTTFNTMSNIYVTAIERSSASQSEPITAINTLQEFSLPSPAEKANLRHTVVTPFVPNYPETPSTAQPISPQQMMDFVYPSTMTATPPLSTGAVEKTSKVFTFSSAKTSSAETSSAETSSPRRCRSSCRSFNSPSDDRTPPRRRRAAFPSSGLLGHMPYTHPRSLRSILRNSPLPPRTAITPPSPGRQSLRLQEKAAKKVEYDSPLEEEITTSKYTRSHIELLAEDGSPLSPANALSVTEPETILDMALLEFTASEIQDGGQTPGPFEDMRRRMAGLGDDAPPISPNASASTNRKRKRTEKKRQWVWTIGQEEDDEHVGGGGAIAAMHVQATDKAKTPHQQHALAIQTTIPSAVDCEDLPTPSIESSSSFTDLSEVEMSDSRSIVSSDDHPGRCLSVPSDTETGAKTPTAPNKGGHGEPRKRDTPIPELAERDDDPDASRTAPTCA